MKKYLITLTFLLAAVLFAVPATAAIVSDFTYTVDPSDPLTIHFTEKSTGGAGNWFWMFNDGGAVSNERNPTHTFSEEGTYLVSCVAQSSDYSEENTMRKQLTITLGGVTDVGDLEAPLVEAVPAVEIQVAESVSRTSHWAASAFPTRWTSSVNTSNSSV